MIRFIAIAIVLFIYLIVGIPVLIVEYFVGLVNRRAKDYSCLRMVQWTFRLMLKNSRCESNRHRGGECAR